MAPRPDGVYLDGTLGGGGHSEGILRLSGGTARLYGIDRDGEAIAAATARLGAYPAFGRFTETFTTQKALLGAVDAPPLTGALVDWAWSSHQLDEASRGFSYHEDAPLDMRMDPSRVPRPRNIWPAFRRRSFAASSPNMARKNGPRALRRSLWNGGESVDPDHGRPGGRGGCGHPQSRAPQGRRASCPPHVPGRAHRAQRRAGPRSGRRSATLWTCWPPAGGCW